MRILLALLALGLSVGAAAACDMHRSHSAVLASASTLIAPMPEAAATVTALPQSRMVEEVAMSTPELATSPYGRGCRNERQTTVYLTQ
ncbi:MAG TPA: hypothetical protein VIK47_01230 [Kiloniellales bacterium]|nr:hypothetical protein [Aestuariivirga sp.]